VRARARRGDETGAYLILYALLAVAFFTMAAIVLDIAALRQGRRSDRQTADLAVTAGVAELDVNDPASARRACDTAWGYILANRTESSGAISAPDCAALFPTNEICTAALGARTATASIGPVSIEITNPVPDSSPLMNAETQGGDQAQVVDAGTDGAACARLSVRVVRARTFLFGQIAGTAGATTDVHSVARALTSTSVTEVPGIVSLEATGCDGVASDGGGGTLEVRGAGQSGVIVVDSDASTCGGGGFAINPQDPGRITARPNGPAPGVISSFALGGSGFARAFDPAAVAAGRLDPQPTIAGSRTGRAIIDSRYNCATGGCAVGADHVDQLEAAYGGPGSPALFVPYIGPCVIPAGPPVIVLPGSTYVDCPIFDVSAPVTFSGPAVVFSGDVVVRAGGCLSFNDASCGAIGVPAADGVVFVRGSFTKETTAGVFLPQTFAWFGGSLQLRVDPDPTPDGALTWTAPLGGPFEDLAGWTESAAGVSIGEQDTTLVEGTVFAPNATVTLAARSPGAGLTTPLQVVARRVRLEGAGDVTLNPSAGRATGRLTRQVRLIR